jgi:very-short-patch-repair endonuclease
VKRSRQLLTKIGKFAPYRSIIKNRVDGGQHAVQKEADIERDTYLRQQGFDVIRFWNNEILQNMNGVLEVIRESCLSPAP